MRNELSPLLRKIKGDLEEGIKKATVEAAGVAVDEAPKFSGQLRASVNIGINAPDTSVVTATIYARDAIANPELLSKRKFRSAANAFELGDTIFISNNHHYALTQERREGHLMFAKAADRFLRALPGSF